jgi:aryl-alcohol dehydrogenase-like predicted oxidoreductase
MGALPHRPLGSSGIDVSALALGSWRTFERIPRQQGLAVMLAARESGIDFLDDARYDDTTGKAPIKTGYSEVLFGELFRAAGWKRDDVVVANKLWWEFWPGESAAQELDGSLGRMGLEYLDLVYSWVPPDGLEVAQVVFEVGELIASGKLRAWGVANWPADLLDEATRVAREEELPPPAAAQLPYSLVSRSWVEDARAVEVLVAGDVAVVASAVLAFGALTGKYATAGATGRLAGELDNPDLRAALEAAVALRALADRLGTAPATLAVAFALANPHVASVLFGATSPDQITQNVKAVELRASMSDADLAELRAIGQ